MREKRKRSTFSIVKFLGLGAILGFFVGTILAGLVAYNFVLSQPARIVYQPISTPQPWVIAQYRIVEGSVHGEFVSVHATRYLYPYVYGAPVDESPIGAFQLYTNHTVEAMNGTYYGRALSTVPYIRGCTPELGCYSFEMSFVSGSNSSWFNKEYYGYIYLPDMTVHFKEIYSLTSYVDGIPHIYVRVYRYTAKIEEVVR